MSLPKAYHVAIVDAAHDVIGDDRSIEEVDGPMKKKHKQQRAVAPRR
jgi:hypothetical protein